MEEILEDEFLNQKENFKKIKNELMSTMETHLNELKENSEKQNLQLFDELFPSSFELSVREFLKIKFLEEIQELKKQMISQADLIEFDNLEADNN